MDIKICELMNIWNRSLPGELGPVILFGFLDFLVLPDLKVRIKNHLNPDGLNRRIVFLNSLCMGIVGVSSHRLMKVFSYMQITSCIKLRLHA